MSDKRKTKGRVKVGNLSREEKPLAVQQATKIKGGAGNSGAGGGDCRNGTQVKTNFAQ